MHELCMALQLTGKGGHGTLAPYYMARPDSSDQFTMIGLVHRHADLAKLLAGWLVSIQPDVITMELSSHGVAFRQSRGAELAARLRDRVEELRAGGYQIDNRALEMLLAYIALPSEFAAASDFAAPRGIPLFLVDMDSPSRAHLDHVEELLARDNLVKLLCGPPAEAGCLETTAARLFFEKGVALFPYTEEMCMRDRHMRDRIKELMGSRTGARFVHICGWQHLRDPYGLYGPLNPRKVFIHDKALRV